MSDLVSCATGYVLSCLNFALSALSDVTCDSLLWSPIFSLITLPKLDMDSREIGLCAQKELKNLTASPDLTVSYLLANEQASRMDFGREACPDRWVVVVQPPSLFRPYSRKTSMSAVSRHSNWYPNFRFQVNCWSQGLRQWHKSRGWVFSS